MLFLLGLLLGMVLTMTLAVWLAASEPPPQPDRQLLLDRQVQRAQRHLSQLGEQGLEAMLDEVRRHQNRP